MTAGFKGDYKQFLVRLIVPALFILALGTLYIIFASELDFLVWG
jgi:hypothetical protein